MLISHKYKLIFIHIYKNAGSFVTQMLKKLDKDIVDVDCHITAKNAKKKYPKLWNSYTKICIVRNSWDWQISLFSYMKGSPDHRQHHIVKNMNISEYLEWRKTDLHQQIEFILDDNNICLIDNILSFENLNINIINFFKDKYNMDINPYIPKQKINTSKRNDNHKFYYNEETQKILAEIHQPDIEYFKFKF
jgi:hypothetical protein